MRRVTNFIFVISLLLTVPTLASACFCGYRDAVVAYGGAEVVFVGKVIKIKKTEQENVAMVVKEPDTLEPLKVPRWEKSSDSARIITFEIIESFKGNVEKTFQLLTFPYNGGANCAVNFKVGQSYLVYANHRVQELSPEEAAASKNQWTTEMEMKAEADKQNVRLPDFTTSICDRSGSMRSAQNDVDIIRLGLKNGFTEDLRREARKKDGLIEKRNP